jgi:pimeloyl-ACP methyl ester carboxylesterase
MTPLRLRLYHHPDGTRVAYREAGVGPGLVLLHSAGLTHREFEPVVEHLTHRFRLVLPDLPLHGDSEDRPRHPYTLDWFAEVMAAFCVDTAGARPLVAGHGAGAQVLLRAMANGLLRPERLVLMPTRLHRPPQHPARRDLVRVAARAGSLPGLDRLVAHAAKAVVRPERGMRLSARRNPAARDLVRHAMADVGGNPNLARSWARAARAWPGGAQRTVLDQLPGLDLPVLLLWADEDPAHPLAEAEEALDLLPHGQLRILPGTGYLLAYDDAVGVARELAAFCG